jgi:hypothetical protein
MTFLNGDKNYSRTHSVWNKGIPCRASTKRKIQEHHLQHPELFKFWLGKKRSKLDRQKISEGHLSQKPWNKGLSKEELLKHYPKGFNLPKVPRYTKARREKLRIASTINGNGIILMQKNHLRPTSLENKFIELFNNSKLGMKYTGNGKYFINGKCPDFINIKKKIVIEVRHTKACKFYSKISFRKYASQRIEHYKKAGWKCFVFSEKALHAPNKILNNFKEEFL